MENKETRAQRKVLTGVVVSDKMDKTRTVQVERLVHDARYGKTLKRATKFHAHDEANESKQGDKVEPKQAIGTIFTDPDQDQKTELYFQIYKDRNILNPESWIAK